MPRFKRTDMPAYADHVVEGAESISSQLIAAAVLFTVLLGAMSTVEAPMKRQELHLHGMHEMKRPAAGQELGLLCSIGGIFGSWIAVGSS
jgi:hypothetical protein